MARNETHFFYAERGPTSVYKFRFGDEGLIYVWFEYGESGSSLHTTDVPGPYDASDPLEDAEQKDLDALLESRGLTKERWLEDLMAQYGERIAWTYP